MLHDEMALLMSVAAVVHGELQHALHENGVVPEAGTVHRPQVNVIVEALTMTLRSTLSRVRVKSG